MVAIMTLAKTFHPTTWELVAVSVPTTLIGLWAFWDSWQPPRCRLSARVAIGVSLSSLIQWTTFLALRASGVWDAAEYERVAAPYRLVVLSPLGGWGVWFTMHWFARRKTRKFTMCDDSSTEGDDSGSSPGRMDR